MRKLQLLTVSLLTAFCLQFCGGISESAQTINSKAIVTVDDVVKEVNRGELSIPKNGLITLRGLSNNDNTYLDLFASVFGADSSASAKRKICSNHNPDTSITKWEVKPLYESEPKFFRPAVLHKLYNGERALMSHNIALTAA